MKILHVGCGRKPLPPIFSGEEVRVDIDPSVEPHVVASMTDLGDLSGFGVVYCSHALEHLDADEVGVALREFRRVLDDGGVAIVVVPDLEGIEPTDEVVYEAPVGPITGRDMYYGYGPALPLNPFMAHKTGFVAETLERAIAEAGFIASSRRLEGFNLLGVGVKGGH